MILLDDWAADYQRRRGHVPLIIGREYEYFGQWVRLAEASEREVNVTVVNRSEQPATCDKQELSWKPDKRHVLCQDTGWQTPSSGCGLCGDPFCRGGCFK